jgi:hypothetical protein
VAEVVEAHEMVEIMKAIEALDSLRLLCSMVSAARIKAAKIVGN